MSQPLDDPDGLAGAADGDRVGWLVRTLGEEIMTGELRPGEKLSEPKMAQRFGVSRPPLREAIRRLEERHLVTRTPNQGARVASFNADELLQLLHVREGVEGIAARLAATNASAAGIAELERLCAVQEGASGDEALMLRTDLRFHARIAEMSGSRLLGSFLGDEFYTLFRLVRGRFKRLAGREPRVIQQHRAIVDAIAAHDQDHAEYLMRHHVKSARQAILTVIERNNGNHQEA